MPESQPNYSQALAQEHVRLSQLEELGAAALSRYDIEIAHAGDADLALRTAKRLVAAHIQWYERKLNENPEQQTLFEV